MTEYYNNLNDISLCWKSDEAAVLFVKEHKLIVYPRVCCDVEMQWFKRGQKTYYLCQHCKGTKSLLSGSPFEVRVYNI